jgi:hypothetical protein
MRKAQSLSYTYRLQVLYRVVIGFIAGFIAAALLSLDLTYWLGHSLAKAEAIYLAAFISIIFYAAFVIFSFCMQSLLKLSIVSAGTCCTLLFVLLGIR